MRFYSTSGGGERVELREAVLQGFAPDGGLYLPEELPRFSKVELHKLRGLSFLELSVELATALFKEEFRLQVIEQLCEEAFNFPLPFLNFPNGMHMMELFHGPSFSFKDFGARFLAALMKLYREDVGEMIILAATSGDTGSAVGLAFHNIPGIRVFILYPKGRITPSQEKQITSIGHNVQAIQIDGSFEICQDLLKQAVLDPELKQQGIVTTANSINIGRLLPQALYYFYAHSQLPEEGQEVIFAIPSGNFGHLVSGMLAKKMGLPVFRFLGATNVNNEVPLFLRTGIFEPHEAYPTLAVSMDVGNPSNLPRLLALYEGSLERLRADLLGSYFTDAQIAQAIQEMYATYGYLLDPHSAIAYMALRAYPNRRHPGIFFATAHPAKFPESLSSIINFPLPIPEKLASSLTQPTQSLQIPPSYEKFKELLSIKIK